jgi:hypothetical protein
MSALRILPSLPVRSRRRCLPISAAAACRIASLMN